MEKEDTRRIEDKIDKHTLMLMDIKDDINKEISIMKLAQQRLKYSITGMAIVLSVHLSIDYPKLVKYLSKLI